MDGPNREIAEEKQLDVRKVFEAIALIISRRGEGNVRLIGIREASEDSRKAG